MIIVFCGHSNYIQNAQDETSILKILVEEAGDSPCEILLGGYGGFDAFAYDCVRKFKKDHSATKSVLVTPYLSVKEEGCLKNHYDSIVYPGLESVPPRYAISHRNRWLVEQADVVIAYVSHRYGGAYAMYLYAKRKGKKIYNLGLL